MSKIVFFGIPAHGHTNPTLAVVWELVRRGHQVWYYSYNMLREKIESAGAVFVPCDEYDMELQLVPGDSARIGKDLAFSTRILVETTLALGDKVCADMEQLKPDCIVADSMAVWGKAVSARMGIPFVSSTTTFAFNRHSAKIMKQSAGEFFRMMLSMPKINKSIRKLQSKGYPFKSILDILQNDENTHTVVYTSPQFQPCSNTFSDRYAFVGPLPLPPKDSIPKTREKLIYISMGTVNNDLLPLYRQLIDTLADTEFQVILSAGNLVDMAAFKKLPDNISVFPSVDQIAVLRQADLFVSHCGMNSASESLYYGVPLVMLPQTTEQRGVAERVHQLGAGIILDRTDPKSVTKAISDILANPKYRDSAATVAEDFRRCSGASGAADKIEQVLRGAL